MKVLILSNFPPSKYLTDALEERGHTWKWYKPSQLYLFNSNDENNLDKVFNGSKELEQPRQILLKKFDAVITRLSGDIQFSTNVLKHLNENCKLYSPQTSVGLLNATDKLRAIQLCNQAGLRVPKTMYAKDPTHVEFLIHKIGGLPSVAKTVRGSQGNGVFILRDPEQTNTSLQAVYKLKVELIIQQYIESEKTDIRAIVVGDKVVAAMERKGSKDFRANLSQKGGTGKKIELSEDDKTLCVNAAKAVGLEFAGVDIIKHYATGKSYVLEVNGAPGTKSIKICGINWFEDLVIHIERQVGGEVRSAMDSQEGQTDLALASESVVETDAKPSLMHKYFNLH